MRILLIRHGDPDYVNDTLTEKGRREAALLAKRAVSMNMGECYKSPLGRAKDTATPCLEVTGKTAEILDWLQEFPAQVDLNKNPELEKAYPDVKKEGEHFLPRIAWDMVPGYWTEHEAYMDKNAWRETEVAKNSDLAEVYDHVIEEFDRFLAEHGYVREGAHYCVEKESDETVTLPCACTDFCDRSSNRRERTGNGIFPWIESRRYLTSLCRWRRTVLRSKIL